MQPASEKHETESDYQVTPASAAKNELETPKEINECGNKNGGMLPPMSASSIRDKDRADLPESPNLREAAEMLQQPTDAAADDPEGLDFLLEDGSAPNNANPPIS